MQKRWRGKANRAKREYSENIENIKFEDVKEAARRGKKKLEELEQNHPGFLDSIWADLKLMVSLLRDYVKGDYRSIPWTSIAATAGAVLYFVNPFDIIPDFIPFAGYLDDAAVLTLGLILIKQDLIKYRKWKKEELINAMEELDIEDAQYEEIDESFQEKTKNENI